MCGCSRKTGPHSYIKECAYSDTFGQLNGRPQRFWITGYCCSEWSFPTRC